MCVGPDSNTMQHNIQKLSLFHWIMGIKFKFEENAKFIYIYLYSWIFIGV